MCNHLGGSVYRKAAFLLHIATRQINANPIQKGRTMTSSKKLATVIWDFPVRIFNIGREKLAQFFANRPDDEGRWLNG